MVHLFALLALSGLVLESRSQPADWLRKFAVDGRDESSWLWGWAWAADGTVSVVDRSPPVTFPARPASFGAELSDPLLGYVLPLTAFTVPCDDPDSNLTHHRADPTLGCPQLCVRGPHTPDPSESWIALVQRGGCPFVEKARQAQQLGARAVVVGGDSDNPDALLNMYSERDSSDVVIAATFIRYWDYVELLSMISASNTTHSGMKTLSLLLSTEYSAWEWYSPIITFIVILLLPSILTFVTLLVHRYRMARQAQLDRAPEAVVHRLPWRVWTGTGWEKHEAAFPLPDPRHAPSGPELDLESGVNNPTPHPSTSHDDQLPEWVEQQVECAICLETFAKGDRVRVLPCYHMFHMDEVDEWLIHKKKLCPVCKMDVTCPHPPASHRSDSAPPPEDSIADDRAASRVQSPPPPRSTSPASERTPLLRDNTDHRYEDAS
ncbi:hypothetical protein EVJ58_g361 [Rhodofomes roseus]|uniref:RING-type E3 ubiquitin transferase n=1 Tax=Rhodofomes roseus TaxID=34475 RepID=A0A4Y9Z3R7_9APHY|nr:hypothetical protein EVJ58_g361 [Rhodofomes roseus]